MVIFVVNMSRYLQYFDTLVHSHHCHLHLFLCRLSLTHPLSPVVLWFLPDPPTREAGLPVLLQNRGDKEEMDGAVWHGHVSMGPPSSPHQEEGNRLPYIMNWIKTWYRWFDSKHSLLFTSRSNIKPERATANQHNFQMHTFEKNTNCRACKMLLR